jgi:putative endonuclease
MKRGGWVYIMTNPHGTLYIGVTADLASRINAHREGRGSEFCKKYGLTRLVYAEEYPTIEEAIAREKAMKRWKRQWKLKLIRAANPGWEDWFDHLARM